jgi:hypothetical protein
MSKRDAPIDIISMAQQASPNVIGQIELLRIQFTAKSSVVRRRPPALRSRSSLPSAWRAQSAGDNAWMLSPPPWCC